MPIQAFAGWDTVYEILGILQQLEVGSYRSAALLSDAMGRDDRIDSVLRTRVGALMAAELDITPADDRRVCAKAAEMLGGVEDGPGQWDRMFPAGVVSQLLRYGVTLNFSVAEIIWTSQRGMWWPRLKFWHPQFVRWDMTRNCFRLMTTEGEIDLPRIDESPIGDGKWFIWCPFGYQNAWLSGMVRSLANIYMRRMWTNRDWPRHNEVNGQPVRKAIVPDSKDKVAANEAFFQAVANYHAEATVKVPQDKDGRGYDVQLLEATARVWESFKEAKEDANTDAAVLVLGQNLTTEAKGTGLGGGGASKTHNLVRLDKAKEDAAFATAIRDQVLIPWAQFNFGDPDIAPLPLYKVEPPDDGVQNAAALKGIGDALQSLHLATPIVDDRSILQAAGVPVFSEEDLKARQEAAAAEGKSASGLELTPSTQGAVITVNEARSANGLGPLLGPGGAPNPDGDLTINEYIAKAAPPPAPPLPGAGFPGSSGNAGDPADGDPADNEAPPLDPEKSAALRAALGKARRAFVATDVAKRYEFAGLPIAIEHPAGTVRAWVDDDGKTTGQTTMMHDYGFIEGHLGSDGDELDCYIGPDENAANVHVVHQLKSPAFKVHDEDKCFIGFANEAAARAAYLAHRNDGERALGAISVIPLARFKAKLQRRRGGGMIRAAATRAQRIAAVDAEARKVAKMAGRRVAVRLARS